MREVTLFPMVAACPSGASIPGEIHLQRENLCLLRRAEETGLPWPMVHLSGCASIVRVMPRNEREASHDAPSSFDRQTGRRLGMTRVVGMGKRFVPEVNIKAE